MCMKLINWILFICLAFVSCQYPEPDMASWNELPAEQSDSLRFVYQHHYTINYNFLVHNDSLQLAITPYDVVSDPVSWIDSTSLVLKKGEVIAVADIQIVPTDSVDSVYVKVARDQYTMGWTREKDLLKNVTPDDSISVFIRLFSNHNLLVLLLLGVVVVLFYLVRFSKKKSLYIVHFNDIDSPYPSLLCVLVAIAAVFYGGIQHFQPQTWVHYYYYPTLNPFALPWGMGCFILCFWGIVLLGISVADEVFHKLSFGNAITYLVGLACFCLAVYLLFSLTTPYYIGYFFLACYIAFAVARYKRFRRFRCGACGAELPQKRGVCRNCGAINR